MGDEEGGKGRERGMGDEGGGKGRERGKEGQREKERERRREGRKTPMGNWTLDQVIAGNTITWLPIQRFPCSTLSWVNFHMLGTRSQICLLKLKMALIQEGMCKAQHQVLENMRTMLEVWSYSMVVWNPWSTNGIEKRECFFKRLWEKTTEDPSELSLSLSFDSSIQ